MHFLGFNVTWTDPFPLLDFEYYLYLCEDALELCQKPRLWPTEFVDSLLAIRSAGRDDILSKRVTVASTSDPSCPPRRRNIFGHNQPIHYLTKAKNIAYLNPKFYTDMKRMLDRRRWCEMPTEEEICFAFGYTVGELVELEEGKKRAQEMGKKPRKRKVAKA